jgi:hypothetical protein
LIIYAAAGQSLKSGNPSDVSALSGRRNLANWFGVQYRLTPIIIKKDLKVK